ncbi:MAG: hypothetical protein ACJ758_03200, partial [Actinomycetota bacterium]
MPRSRSTLLAALCVAALAGCSANNSTSSVTTGKSTASASVSPQPAAAPSTTAAPMIPGPSTSATAYPTKTVRFHTGQASVHVEGGTVDGKPLAATAFTAALDTSSTDSFNPKSGEFNLRWVDQNG